MNDNPDTPLVSVIVRSMARSTLPAALASLAAQQYPHIEVVVVAASGRSHPEPAVRCGPHALRFVASQPPLQRAHAANAGLQAASGEWITFLDDDDIVLPRHVDGLVAARSGADGARVIHSVARAVFSDGTTESFGQPFSLLQLYERNFIHLSTAIFARSLVAAGCRFDTAFEIHEDWDFFLQLAQHTRFHFVTQQTFEWHADTGGSGAGGGLNQDAAKFATLRDRVYAKWAGQRDTLIDRVQALLQAAGGAAKRGDLAGAAATCREVLDISPNDPWGLNMLAMIDRAMGRLPDALRLQELAVAVRPQDPDLVYNLALLCRDQGDISAAFVHCGRALALDPDNPRYRSLGAMLANTPAASH